MYLISERKFLEALTLHKEKHSGNCHLFLISENFKNFGGL